MSQTMVELKTQQLMIRLEEIGCYDNGFEWPLESQEEEEENTIIDIETSKNIVFWWILILKISVNIS